MKSKLLKTWLLLCALIMGGATSIWAETTYKLTKVTSVSAGNKYVFEQNSHVLSNTVSSNALQTTATYSKSGLAGNESYIWELETATGGFYLKNVSLNSSQYLNNTSGKTNMTFGSKSAVWSIAFTNDVALISNTSNSNRFLGDAGGANPNNTYKAYATSNLSSYPHDFTVYIVEEVVKENPTITFTDGSVRVGQTLDLSTLFSSSSLGTVTYSITAGDSYASLSGSILTGDAEGSVTVKATQAATDNYNAGEATATFTVNAAKTLSSIEITTAPTKTTYTEGETFDPAGMVVRATYSDTSTDIVTASCTYSPNTALSTSDTEITVSYTENAVEKTTTQAITVNPLPKYTVTFSDGGSLTEASYGAGVTLPSRSKIGGYTFAGWSASKVDTETTSAPTIIPAGSYTPTGDTMLYPVYTRTEVDVQNKTASKVMSENGWSNETQYTSLTLDENVSATANGNTNTGKYYTNDNTWRFYQTESGKVTISTTSGELTSVTFTFTVANTGTLNYNSSVVTSGTAVDVSGTSAEFTVGNSGTKTNGQVKITAISVDYTASSSTTYYVSSPKDVTLTDGQPITRLSALTGEACNVTYTRSFTSGTASTVCLPFAYTKKGGDGSFYEFTDIEEEGGEYVATLTEPVSTTLTANTPYLFVPTASSVEFTGSIASVPSELTAGETTSNGWTFKGTFETIEWKEAPTGIYGFSAQNKDDIYQGQFVKVGEYVRITPMRCYLQYGDGTSDWAGVRSMNRAAEQLPDVIKVRLVSAEGDVTAIGSLSTKTGEVSFDKEGWYTLDGRRIEGKPSTKGIYVNNGKKVIIK